MSVLTDVIARVLFLPALMVATAIIVKAHAVPGDGFSAGLVAAMAFLVMEASAPAESHLPTPSPVPRRAWLGASGLVPMLLIAFVPLVVGVAPLTHAPKGPPPALGELHLDSASLFDLGIAILVFGITLFAVRLFDPRVAEGRP